MSRLVPDVVDFGDADEGRVDRISGVYRISPSTTYSEGRCPAQHIGQVMLTAAQETMAKLLGEVPALPDTTSNPPEGAHIH